MKTDRSPRSVLIADAEPLSRQGLCAELERRPEYKVLAAVDSMAAAREAWRRRAAALVVVDTGLDGGEALTFIKECVEQRPETSVVVLSAQEDAVSVERALQAGAHGYLSRRDALEDVRAVLAQARPGHRRLGTRVSEHFLDGAAAGLLGGRSARGKLSGREWEVYNRLGEGGTVQEIAKSLHCSPKTVETHLRRIRTKLHAGSTRALQRLAILARAGGTAEG